MRYVLDASVALKWVLAEPDAPTARRLRGETRAGAHALLAPDVFPTEVGNGLTKAERKKQIAVGDAAVLLADVLTTLPGLAPAVPRLIARAVDISSAEAHPVSDCLYVALAEREGCQLVTADDKLLAKLKPKFPFLVALADLP